MYSLARLTLAHMSQASAQLRKVAKGASSMEEAGQQVTRFFFDHFGDEESDRRGCVLVRLYVTQRLRELPDDLRHVGVASMREAEAGEPSPNVRCLVLLASTGVEDAWCSRHTSRSHRVIPLPSAEAIARLPMVAQLVAQLGVDVPSLVTDAPSPLVDVQERSYNVFHVPEARGCPHIPAQDFVERYGVRSVLGFGGQLPDGELYSVIMFARVFISRDTAEAFKPLTLALKLALLPFQGERVFAPAGLHGQS